MGIGKRIAQIFRSRRFDGDDVEKLKDKLDETYRDQTALLQRVRRSVADVATSRKRIELQLSALNQQGAELDDQARQLVSAGDDDATQGRAQWWFVSTSPRDDTNDAEHPGKRTEARRTWSSHVESGVKPYVCFQ